MPDDLTRLTVDIPTLLHRRAKIFAAQTGRDLREVVTAALDEWLPPAKGIVPLSPKVMKRLQSLDDVLKKGGKS